MSYAVIKDRKFQPFKRPPVNGMLCPRCDEMTRVLDSRATLDNEIWRRRVCLNGHRWTTVERWGEKHGKVLNKHVGGRRGK
jgi:transcriptional regulator NrdR family protein